MAFVLTALALGIVAGVLSGVFGIGGGVVIVPGLILLLGFGQKTATGTSLMALLLPVGALAVFTYADAGHVDVRAGLLIAAGMFGGALLGAKLALGQPDALLTRLFALLLIGLAVRLLASA